MSAPPHRREIEIVCLQLEAPDDEPPEVRFERVLAELEEVAASAHLVVLPELWVTGYFAFDRYAADAEPIDGPRLTALGGVARRHGIHLAAGSFIERDGDALYNTALLIGPDGGLLQSYRKMHLFGYGSQEDRLLTPGRRLEVADTELGRIGTTTCYDLRFPELYRLLVDRGLEILVIPAAWPYARIDHWRTLLRARAIENQLLVVSCNAAGHQGEVRLGGSSTIVGPWGQTLAEAGAGQAMIRAHVDAGTVGQVREEFPVLQHRRIFSGELGEGTA